MFCIPSPVWDTWSLILHPLRRMQCKHLLIIRVECTLTHNTRNLIKARDGENVLYPLPCLGYLEPYFTSPPKDAVQAPTHN